MLSRHFPRHEELFVYVWDRYFTCNTQSSLGWKLFMADLVFCVSNKNYQNIFHEVRQITARYYLVSSSCRHIGSSLVARARRPRQGSSGVDDWWVNLTDTSWLWHMKTSGFIYFRGGYSNIRWWHTLLKALGAQGLHLAFFEKLQDNWKRRSWRKQMFQSL